MTMTPRLPLCLLATALVLLPAQEGPDPFGGLRYRCVGPTRGGRVTAVAGVEGAPGTYFMGATGGGVWKTTDFGQRWRCVSDGYFASPSIGAIAVARSNPLVVWVGTGSDGLRSNVIPGRGVYRSEDAGVTWSFVGLRDCGQIGAVEVHPENADVAFVAAIGNAFRPNPERGLFRTKDGGKTWEKVLFVSGRCGIVDVEFAPDDPNTLYAAAWKAERKPWTILSGGDEGGIYKSIDGGDTWKKLGGGLPSGVVGKADLAVSRADPDRVYALVEAKKDPGLYRSDDRGRTWRKLTNRSGLLDRPFYYCNVDADPNDADVVYVSATGFWKSTDGGNRFRRVSTPHGDNHDLWIDPADSLVMVQANDGGANVTRDGCKTWSTQRNQPTAELYTVDVDDREPYWLYSGQQDNSTIRVPSGPVPGSAIGAMGNWETVGGCETGPAVPKPGDPDIVYAACKGRFGRFNMRTGQEQQYYVGAVNMYGHDPKDLPFRFQRVAPLTVSPHDASVVYHGSQFVHRTRDEGRTWETISPDLTAFTPETQGISGAPITRDITGEEFYSTLYAIRESPVTRGVIWAGANDGPVHVTRNDGITWKNVTPPDLPEGGRVDCVEPSPHDPAKAYVAVLRYQLGDDRPYVYRTNDFGESWTLLTGPGRGVPDDFPTRVVREDPEREGLLYLGCEFGLFVSFDDGGSWRSLQRNLPVTPITDMLVKGDDLVLSTMGRSFWVLDDLTPLRHAGLLAAGADLVLFPPRVATRRRGGSRGALTAPPSGAVLDYHVGKEPASGLTLEIFDAAGRTVQKVRSSAPAARPGPAPEQGMRGPRRRRPARGGLRATPGGHRFVWNLRERDGSGRRGPLALPGSYRVVLSAGDLRVEQPLIVVLDPRVVADGVTQADLIAQRELQEAVAATQRRASALLEEVKRREQTARGAPLQELLALRDALDTPRITYPRPRLVGQLRYLASMIDRADQRPGRDAYVRHEQLSGELASLRERFDALVNR